MFYDWVAYGFFFNDFNVEKLILKMFLTNEGNQAIA